MTRPDATPPSAGTGSMLLSLIMLVAGTVATATVLLLPVSSSGASGHDHDAHLGHDPDAAGTAHAHEAAGLEDGSAAHDDDQQGHDDDGHDDGHDDEVHSDGDGHGHHDHEAACEIELPELDGSTDATLERFLAIPPERLAGAHDHDDATPHDGHGHEGGSDDAPSGC